MKSIPGDIAALICLDAEYICLTRGIRFMNHSPIQKTVAPIHDETKTPIRNTKANDVIKPSPAPQTKSLHIVYITFKTKSKVKYQDPNHPLKRLKNKEGRNIKEFCTTILSPCVCVDRK